MLVEEARMRRNPACTKALGELDDGAVRRKLYFFFDQHLVDACLLDRANAVAGRRQRAHESNGQASVERILAGELAPPPYGVGEVAPRFGLVRKTLQRSRVLEGDLLSDWKSTRLN